MKLDKIFSWRTLEALPTVCLVKHHPSSLCVYLPGPSDPSFSRCAVMAPGHILLNLHPSGDTFLLLQDWRFVKSKVLGLFVFVAFLLSPYVIFLKLISPEHEVI